MRHFAQLQCARQARTSLQGVQGTQDFATRRSVVGPSAPLPQRAAQLGQQLTGFFLTWLGAQGRGRALGCGEVKFTGQVLPTAKTVTYEVEITRLINRKLVMAQADARTLVDGREIYTARDLRVGLFTSTEGF